MKWLYIHLLLQHFSCGYFKYSIKCIRSQNYFVIHFFQLILFQRWNTAWSPWKVSIRNSGHIFVIWIDMKNCLTNKLSQYKINWTLFSNIFVFTNYTIFVWAAPEVRSPGANSGTGQARSAAQAPDPINLKLEFW